MYVARAQDHIESYIEGRQALSSNRVDSRMMICTFAILPASAHSMSSGKVR
jgi:hypothetical protein